MRRATLRQVESPHDDKWLFPSSPAGRPIAQRHCFLHGKRPSPVAGPLLCLTVFYERTDHFNFTAPRVTALL